VHNSDFSPFTTSTLLSFKPIKFYDPLIDFGFPVLAVLALIIPSSVQFIRANSWLKYSFLLFFFSSLRLRAFVAIIIFVAFLNQCLSV